MKTISPFSFAAILILVRIFALSMYAPSGSENPAITAVCVAALSALKFASFIPLFILAKKNKITLGKKSQFLRAVLAAFASAEFLLMINDAFSTVVESVYPDRFTRIGITAVFIFIAAYVASMGMNSLSRTASICSVTFIIVLSLILLEMRESMQTYHINLYSQNIGGEISRTVRNILAFTGDYFLFFLLLPYLRSSPAKAAGLYITVDVLLSAAFFLMSAAVMGSFWPKSGFSFFTLAYCTHGSIIDRSDGVFLAVSAVCALICGAAFMTVFKDSMKYLFPIKSESKLYLCSAFALTAVSLSLLSFGLHIGEHTWIHSLTTTAALFFGSIVRMCIPKKKGAQPNET